MGWNGCLRQEQKQFLICDPNLLNVLIIFMLGTLARGDIMVVFMCRCNSKMIVEEDS